VHALIGLIFFGTHILIQAQLKDRTLIQRYGRKPRQSEFELVLRVMRMAENEMESWITPPSAQHGFSTLTLSNGIQFTTNGGGLVNVKRRKPDFEHTYIFNSTNPSGSPDNVLTITLHQEHDRARS
jgi:hypothetical protein